MVATCNRRRFMETTALAGGAVLACPACSVPAWTMTLPLSQDMPKARIHKVYVGRTGGIYLSRPTEEIAKLETHLKAIEQRLGNIEFVGGETIPPATAAEVVSRLAVSDGVLMFHLSGHGGDAPKQAMDQIIAHGMQTAVFSQPFSGHGWMYFPRWQKEGRKVVLLPTSDWNELERVAALMRVAPQMRRTRILVVGQPKGTAPACSADLVRERLGAELVSIDNRQVIDAWQAVDAAEAEAEAEQYWIGQAREIREPTREDIVAAARLYLAVRGLMEREGAQAVTSSHCMGEPAKGCLAFSKLNDLGKVGACEGDMDSTLTMLLFAYAFGIPGFISDPVIDTARGAVVHFHCTSATRMDGPTGERRPFTIRTQSDSDRGVSLDVEQRIGQVVTCAKLANLDTMLISTGKITGVTHDELGCRTQFWTEVPDADRMFSNWGAGLLGDDTMTLLHRVVFYGDHSRSIRDLGRLLGFSVVEEG